MPDHISISHNSGKSDCLICAIRPILYLNQINIYQATFFCPHSIRPSNPHFHPSNFLKIVTVIINLLLLYAVYNNINQIFGKFVSNQVFILLEIIINIIMVLYNTTFLVKNRLKLQESHGLITIIQKKVHFGVATILSNKAVKKIHNILLYLSLTLVWEELITLSIVLSIEDIDQFVRICLLEVLILLNAGFGLCFIQILVLYENVFSWCYYEMEMFLKNLANFEQRSPRLFIEKLQKLQRLYMCLRRNFKLNEEFFQPGVFILFSLYVCLLLIGYGYYVIIFFAGEERMLVVDMFLLLKSLSVAIAFGCFCFQAQKISTMSENILSILFKHRVSKMSLVEAAQVEMLISALTLQKPVLKASDILIFGTGLLVSISGTVLTYILVALQFHALWVK